MKTIITISKVWSTVSILFLGWFILSHLFSHEPMIFTNKKELLAFLFFPLGILFGLMLTYRWEILGGGLCLISATIVVLLLPELIKNIYFILITSPGILLLIFKLKTSYSKI